MPVMAIGSLSNTPQNIKPQGMAGVLRSVAGYNSGASDAYLQFFNAPASAVTVGTTVPVMIVPLPSASGIDIPLVQTDGRGVEFPVGISVAATSSATGGSAPATTVLLGRAEYT